MEINPHGVHTGSVYESYIVSQNKRLIRTKPRGGEMKDKKDKKEEDRPMKALTTAAILSVFAMGTMAMAQGGATSAPATAPAASATTATAGSTSEPVTAEKAPTKAKKAHKKMK